MTSRSFGRESLQEPQLYSVNCGSEDLSADINEKRDRKMHCLFEAYYFIPENVVAATSVIFMGPANLHPIFFSACIRKQKGIEKKNEQIEKGLL